MLEEAVIRRERKRKEEKEREVEGGRDERDGAEKRGRREEEVVVVVVEEKDPIPMHSMMSTTAIQGRCFEKGYEMSLVAPMDSLPKRNHSYAPRRTRRRTRKN